MNHPAAIGLMPPRRRGLAESLQGTRGGIPGFKGIVDVVLRNAETNEIEDHRHQHNMTTEELRSVFAIVNSVELQSAYVFIHENDAPMRAFRTLFRTVMPGTFVMAITPTRDGPNRLWTYQAVFATPAVDRVVRTIGLSLDVETAGFTNVKGGPGSVIAATVLSAPLTQLTSQTLEITYRLAFQRT